MSSYRDLLRAFLNEASDTQLSLAAKIGTSQAAISRYLSGDRFPDMAVAKAIDSATSGAVPLPAWQIEMASRIGLPISRPKGEAA